MHSLILFHVYKQIFYKDTCDVYTHLCTTLHAHGKHLQFVLRNIFLFSFLVNIFFFLMLQLIHLLTS
ncbi:hypothetical protein XELAEV_18030353mg [Xenopus laevis]|uniref:Uncharacterized protein n=1 Tax=Xenopus laevis TaxID=8355 RepID=A0A974CKN7_XENLA|nr:hypothetical protein XELAEV_18030353mg [Xenopus laevis]